MRASSSARWRSRTSTRSTGCPRRSRSTRRARSRNPRSTVGTVTEIYDHLRLLFARIGHPALPERPRDRAPDGPADRGPGARDARGHAPARARPADQGPQDRGRPGLRGARASRASCACAWTARRTTWPRRRRSTSTSATRSRSSSTGTSCAAPRPRPTAYAGPARDERGQPIDPETAWRWTIPIGRGWPIRSRRRSGSARASSSSRRRRARVRRPSSRSGGSRERYSCPYDGTTIDELEPRSFSFNSPHGACPTCTGLGVRLEIDPDLVIPDRGEERRPGRRRAVGADASTDASWRLKITEAVFEPRLGPDGADPRPAGGGAGAPPASRAKDEQVVIRYKHERGENSYVATFEGVVTNLERRYKETDSEYIKAELEKYMVERPCPTCKGKRLRPEALGGDRRRARHLRRRRPRDHRRAGVGDARSRAASPSASGRSPTRCSRRSGRGSASSSTSGSTT